MKRKNAKEILAESFQELAAGRSIDKITVKEITDNCGYSVATFYRQFQDKYDLIAWDYTRRIAEIVSRIGGSSKEWKETLLECARHYREEKEYLANLLLHTEGYDSFLRYMTEINCSELEKCVRRMSGREELEKTIQMYIRLYCMGTVCLSCEWILGKYDASAEEMAEIYERSLPEPLKPLLAGG
ncbi:MAG: TetR/AcrR family transcriptional regulator C-terminal domain-containing protein [Lachnospiraceae bacterium]|nr:TetR/AcrR family transcriptional regulator C-terminal domain-containing protein [Lachnospiraceae bacterium]